MSSANFTNDRGTAEKQTIAGKFFNFAVASRRRLRYLAETGVNVKVIHRELQRRKTLYVQMSNKRRMQSIIAMRKRSSNLRRWRQHDAKDARK